MEEIKPKVTKSIEEMSWDELRVEIDSLDSTIKKLEKQPIVDHGVFMQALGELTEMRQRLSSLIDRSYKLMEDQKQTK